MRTCCLLKITFATVLTIALSHSNIYAQAFRKGSLLISASEGAAYSSFNTSSNTPYDKGAIHEPINGDRDPLTVEYGISNRWSIGLSLGGDIYHVNTNRLYNYETRDKAQAITGELTVDLNYHFLVTKKLDLSGYCSTGLSGISIIGNDGDRSYQYNAGGTIVRLGAKARYYVLGRIGVMGMLSSYSTNLSPAKSGNTMGANLTTTIRGFAWELGLCYRVLR